MDVLSYAMGRASAKPSGDITLRSLTVTENNKIYRPASGEAFSSVRTAIPEIETEEKDINENGSYEAGEGKAFKKVNVVVPQGVFPSGTKEITENGEHDVTEFEKVEVNVEGGGYPEPVGEIEITQNGEYDVKDKAVAKVKVEGDSLIDFATNFSFDKRQLPEKVVIKNDYKTNYEGTFSDSSGVNYIEISTKATVTTLRTAFQNCDVETVKLNLDTHNVTAWGGTFRSMTPKVSRLKTIIGQLDFSSCNQNGSIFDRCEALEDVELKENTLPISMSLNGSPFLTNASLVSIANGLKVAASALTLTLHATPKAKLSAIMGNVADDIFTADEGGAVTLADFITETKGWTVA